MTSADHVRARSGAKVTIERGWRLKAYQAEDPAVDAARSGSIGDGWLPASVPGSVAWDLVAAGEAPNAYHERATLAMEWIAERAWRYSVEFEVPSLTDDERAWLHLLRGRGPWAAICSSTSVCSRSASGTSASSRTRARLRMPDQYTFEVNGRRVYATGWNWVPVDIFDGVPRPEAEAHLLRLARDAHVVLLRVWGGGLIESTSFYDACDRLGIMVWQELSQSSSGTESAPSTDLAFIELLPGETRAIVSARRAHPSLVLWCGGNELADETGPLDELRSPVLASLRDVFATADPDRAWPR